MRASAPLATQRLFGIACLALLVIQTTASFARGDVDRVLVLVDEHAAFAIRLTAELSALGLRPIPITVDHLPEIDELTALARQQNAGVAIAVAPDEPGARVRILDRVTGKVLQRDIAFGPADGDRDAVIALRAVELLRASLLELSATHPRRGDVPPTRTLAAIGAPAVAPSPFSEDLGLALGGGPGGTPLVAQMRVGAAARLEPRLSIEATAFLPVYPLTLSGSEGSAAIWISSLLVALRAPLTAERGSWRAFAAAGGLGSLVIAYGRANRGYSGSESHAANGGPAAELGLRVAVGSTVGLRLDTVAALFLAPVELAFGAREVARLGQPSLFVSGGIDFGP